MNKIELEARLKKYMNNETPTSTTDKKDACETLKNSGIKKDAGLEVYLKNKIPRIKEIVERINQLEANLYGYRIALAEAMKEEIEELRDVTGIDYLATKSKALSRLANDKLIEIGENK